MLTNGGKKKLRELINYYADTCVAVSWMGGGNPAHHDEILEDKAEAKCDLYKFIRDI